MINKIEEGFKQFYTSKNCRGLSTIFTPKIVRDKMTIHAKPEMKILVMFNFEFCYDLSKMGCKDVMFVSDDELRNKIVEEAWGFKTELIDPRSINKKITGMKFDLIISNPPYNKGLDLKILDSILDFSDNICFVHPSGWLNLKYDIKNIRSKLVNRVSSFEIFNGNEVFGIANHTPCVITNIFKESDKIKVIDNFYSNTEYYTKNIYDVHKYGYAAETIKSILSKIEKFPKLISVLVDNREAKKPLAFGIPITRGHVASSDFYTLVQKTKKPHFNDKSYYQVIPVESEEQLENLYSFLRLKIVRFFLSIRKEGLNLKATEMKLIPLLSFSRKWTDEECAKELGITNEELLWMIQQIPNYYPEDVETYRKLEEKLKEQLKN